jgi:hypothetical protein
LVEHKTKHSINVSKGRCKLKKKRGVCLRVGQKVRRRRTGGVCLWVNRKVKRRKTGGKLTHVHEKFKLWLVNQEEEGKNALVISLGS